MDGAGTGPLDPQVPERARRRTFTAKYKLEVLAAYESAPQGEKGAVLRREALVLESPDRMAQGRVMRVRWPG